MLSDVICCTFHQNSSADVPFEKYDEVTYAKLIAICLKEFHELGIPKEKILLNIGYYGDAEVSFSLDMNPNKIEDLPNLLKVLTFAQKFNQQSVYLSFIDETMLNQYCEAKYNEIKGID